MCIAVLQSLQAWKRSIDVPAQRRGFCPPVYIHVGEQCSVSLLLLSHELDEGDVFLGQASGEEVFLGERGDAVVEGVKLDPFLIEAQHDGFVVEVALNHVPRLTAVRSKP